MADYLVGIDFGACNIKVSFWNRQKPRVMKLNTDGYAQSYAPNAILYDLTDDGEVERKIGQIAKDGWDYDNSVEHIKRKLELPNWSQFIKNLDRALTATEVTHDIFVRLKEIIDYRRPADLQGKPMQAVLTVPVCFSGVQKKRIYEAATSAGIPVTSVVTEPFAAMFSLEELIDGDEDGVVVIFDFGGSTLDLSLLRVTHDEDLLVVEELASAGINYGGLDIDEDIFTDILEKKYAKELADIRAANAAQADEDQARASALLIDQAGRLKENLFSEGYNPSKPTHEDFTPYGTHDRIRFELSAAEVKELLDRQGRSDQIKQLLDALFEQTAEVTKTEVTLVKAFGGTSRISYFLDVLQEYFGEDLFDSEDYFEDKVEDDDFFGAVASGAVRYLALCNDDDREVEITSKIPFSIGAARGNRFIKYLDCNPPYGHWTKMFKFSWRELESNGGKLNVYQSFVDARNISVDGKDGAVFLGSVPVERSLYESDDVIGVKMRMLAPGKLELVFMELRGGKLTAIETKQLELGAKLDG